VIGVDDRHPAHHAVGRLHRDGADAALAEVLFDFADDVDGLGHVETFGDDAQGGVNRRQVAALELDVKDGADDLHDAPLREGLVRGISVSVRRRHTLPKCSS
jgi:hypothetical protein